MGLAADIGTLQRMPKVIGNDSLFRELVYTSRKFSADEAKEMGYVSKIAQDSTELFESGLKLAETIAEKTPIAVQGSKVNINFSRDHSVEEGLKFMSAWNGSMLQSEDVLKAGMAAMTKEKATYDKL
jgi:delta(3,5)-delta(2,4)-dienoyl-CoA isomerase